MAFDIKIESGEINKKGGKALEDIGESVKEVSTALTNVLELKCSTDKVNCFRVVLNDCYRIYQEHQLKENSNKLYIQFKRSLDELNTLVNDQIRSFRLNEQINVQIPKEAIDNLLRVQHDLIIYRNKAIELQRRKLYEDFREFDAIEEREPEHWSYNPFVWFAISAGGLSFSTLSYFFPGFITTAFHSASNIAGTAMTLLHSSTVFSQSNNAISSPASVKDRDIESESCAMNSIR